MITSENIYILGGCKIKMKGSSKMKRTKMVVCTFMLIAALVYSANLASAYVPESYKWPGTSYPIVVTYKYGDRLTGTSIIKTAFSDALSTWNQMQMRINFQASSSSNNVLNSYSVTSSIEYGYMQPWVNSDDHSILTHFEAYVNAGNTNITKTNVARSAATHELGHAMSLYEGNMDDSIMNQNRDRTQIYRPRQDDLDGVNEIYY